MASQTQQEPKAPSIPRPARARAACLECRKVKQRCSGLERIPCKRCELYNLTCTFETTAAAGGSRGNSSSSAPRTSRAPPTIASTSTSTYQSSDILTRQLQEISQRLGSLEMTLNRPPSNQEEEESTADSYENESQSSGRLDMNNPLVASLEIFKNFENILPTTHAAHTSPSSASTHGSEGGLGLSTAPVYDSITRSDAITQGILSPQDAHNLFMRFFATCGEWLPPFDRNLDGDFEVVRKRSPILFHAICTTAQYFRMGDNPRELAVYRALTRCLYQDIGQQIISYYATGSDVDLVMALCLCQLWKVPVPTEHPDLPITVQAMFKFNDMSSFLTGSLTLKVLQRTKLDQAPLSLRPPNKPTPESLRASRVYWLCLVIDNQASLQAGRAPNLVSDPIVLNLLKPFASLKDRPTDVALAALADVSKISKSAPLLRASRRTGRAADLRALEFARNEFDKWKLHWHAVVRDENIVPQDKFIIAVVNIFEPFIRFRVFSYAIRWFQEAISTHSPSSPVPSLGTDERFYLTTCISTAEELITHLCVESRTPYTQQTGVRQEFLRSFASRLQPDPEIADVVTYGPDTCLDVMIPWPALFLGKLAVDGLLGLDLGLTMEPGTALMSSGTDPSCTKLCRLLQLCSEFLYLATQTVPHHPARLQAEIISKLRETLIQRTLEAGPGAPLMWGQMSGPPLDSEKPNDLDLSALMKIDWELLGVVDTNMPFSMAPLPPTSLPS